MHQVASLDTRVRLPLASPQSGRGRAPRHLLPKQAQVGWTPTGRSNPHMSLDSRSLCAMKRCGGCGRNRPLADFAWRDRARGKRGSRCRRCKKSSHRAHYLKNRATYVLQAAERKQRLQMLVDDMKRGPCADCSGTFHPAAMDFDHVRGGKIMNVSRLIRRGSEKAILAEISKCELVCSNCHRVRTWTRSSAAERLPHTQRVAGSSPAVSTNRALVAQVAERAFGKGEAPGSSPGVGTTAPV